jgi:hypothetical protein
MQFIVRCGYHPSEELQPEQSAKRFGYELFCPKCRVERQDIRQLQLPHLPGWSPSDPPLVLPRDLEGSRSK